MRVVASYTDLQGTAESMASGATIPVTNVNDAPTGSVNVEGMTAQGQTLTASSTLGDIDGMGTVSYQWQFSTNGTTNWTAITGATASTYTLGASDVGRYVRVVASYRDQFNTAESVSGTPAMITATAGRTIVFADTSGMGGAGGSAWLAIGVSGGAGDGGSQVIRATNSAGDIVFADGSGGGTGGNPGGSSVRNPAGTGGSGNDTIYGGTGHDIIFADGFQGQLQGSTAADITFAGNSVVDRRNGGLGGYGGGGSGGESGTQDLLVPATPGGIGAGAGAAVTAAGGATTLGPVRAGGAINGNAGGGGAGVLASNNVLSETLYSQILNDVQGGTGGDLRVFRQIMGVGNDRIEAGAGNDWVMAGGGHDTVIGGQGNDTLWGRGGGNWNFLEQRMGGTTSAAEQTFFNFVPIRAGESVTVGGLTLTAKADMSALQVASHFTGLNSSAAAVSRTDTELASFSGQLVQGWVSSGNSSSYMVQFSATVLGNVADLAGTSPMGDNDTFIWQAGDAGTGATDRLRDFVAWNGSSGDKLDISALLEGYTAGVSNLSQWVTLATSQTIGGTANSSRLTIDIDGAGSGTVTQVIELQGTNLTGSTLTTLVNNGVLIA